MPKTKLAGWLMIGATALKVVADVASGHGVNIGETYQSVMGILLGTGLIRGRTAIQKILDKVTK